MREFPDELHLSEYFPSGAGLTHRSHYVTEVAMSARWALDQPRVANDTIDPSYAPQALRLTPSERALAESTQRYRSLFAYNPHAAFSLDLNGKYEDANPAAERLCGYSLAELRRMDFTKVIHPEDLQRVQREFTEVLNRRARQFEARVIHRDGHAFELSLTVVPVIVCGEVVGVHGIAEDVTERNEMRRELERTRMVAEEASATKSLFLANMSHEVRTPLTSVLAATEMLAEAELDPSNEHLVEIIERSGERLLRLVNDILDFSRLEAGKVQLHATTISLRGIADEVTRWAAPMARLEGLVFTATLGPELPRKLRGDDLRINQVLTNLIENAVKFTNVGQVRLFIDIEDKTTEPVPVIVTVPGAEPEPESATVKVRFSVQDTGIGIPGAALPALLKSFTQADPSSTREYGGAGLGLAICQELVALMGGTLSAESTPGSGSTFWFTMPLEVVAL